MKELKDYLPHYIGCKCKSSEGTMIYTLIGTIKDIAFHEDKYCNQIDLCGDFKPILRPLSDMTEEEALALAKIHDSEGDWRVVDRCRLWILVQDQYANKIFIQFSDDGNLWDCEDADGSVSGYETFEAVKYLFSRGFDLFGLIESGLAIDKTKSSPQP